MWPFLPLRDWVNAAGLLLMLSATACAALPTPQVAALPPGQARIWFYRLWDPSESLNVANIDVNGVYAGSVEPGGAFYRDVGPGIYRIVPENRYFDYNQNTNVAVVPGEQIFIAVLDLGNCRERCSVVRSSSVRETRPSLVWPTRAPLIVGRESLRINRRED